MNHGTLICVAFLLVFSSISGCDASSPHKNLNISVVATDICSPLHFIDEEGNSVPLLVEAGPKIPVRGKEVALCTLPTSFSSHSVDSKSGRIEYSTQAAGQVLKWQVSYKIGGQVAELSYTGGQSISALGVSIRSGNGWLGKTVPTRIVESYPNRKDKNIYFNESLDAWIYPYWDLSSSSACRTASGQREIDGNFPSKGIKDSFSTLLFCEKGDSQDRHAKYMIGYGASPLEAIPVLKNPKSAYKKDLENSIYFDIWGGSFSQARSMLEWAQELSHGALRNVTIVQDWQENGFDSDQPRSFFDQSSISQKKGGEKALIALARSSEEWGRFGIRTNYMKFSGRRQSPGLARAKDQQRKAKWNVDPLSVMHVVEDQERLLKNGYAFTAAFSDQLTSGGNGFPYLNFSGEKGRRIENVRKALISIAETIKSISSEPLLSETLNAEYLLGHVDGGDYGLFSGHSRPLDPGYKLYRLHGLATYYGAGLPYRFFEMPPYVGDKQKKGTEMYVTRYRDGADDYRATTVLYGNAAYVYFYPWVNKGMVVSEMMTVGLAQKHYLNDKVKFVKFFSRDKWIGWNEKIVENGEDFCDYINIEYMGGLHVFVNRGDATHYLKVPRLGKISLPKYSYAIYNDEGSFVSVSAIPEDQSMGHRIDYTYDGANGIEFIDPRGKEYRGLTKPTVTVAGKVTYDGSDATEDWSKIGN